MGIIQCAEDCKYQFDGYCQLEICSNVNSLDNICPHYVSRLTNNGESLRQIADTDKFY